MYKMCDVSTLGLAVDTSTAKQVAQRVHVFPCDLDDVQMEPECLLWGSSWCVFARKADKTALSQVLECKDLCK